MKAHVDQESCIGCGLCTAICPRAFKMNKGGLAEAVETDLENSIIDEAEEAKAQCPVEAISINK